MAKFTKGFPEELMLASINCFDGVYSKGIFSYTWHYKTKNYIFEFNDVLKRENDQNQTYVCKIILRNPWYLPNELIYDNGWLFGYRAHEYRVQKAFDEMILAFKDRHKKNAELYDMEALTYKEANERINKS